MQCQEFPLIATDHTHLQAKCWETTTTQPKPKAIVCLIHGFGEHSGRYEHVAQALTAADYTVLALDSRGHGKSAGARGFIPSYEQFLEDVDVFLEDAVARYPDEKLFLYGHSTGGGLVLRYVLERRPEIAGVIASSPWILLARDPGFIAKALMWVFGWLRPEFSISTGHTPGLLSRDPAVDEALLADPLNHHTMTAGLMTGATKNGQILLERAAEFPPIPLLQMHGDSDKIISFKASKTFTSKTPAETTTFIPFDEGAHELHNDLCKDEIFEAMISWLDAQAL